ncbi:hypothetical protein [Rhodococcus sp. BH5]|uniref:hypothetical protein n=1 Tax=Rhodococcus sp. BH5 TaxID=2871702 RepID=UPI0022CD62F8|nr:hypothetical protein [Rhodococcus sp. BH5]MCZ9635160.1 hypothetical protein [Rhodococcus sp. BH5]
MAEPISHRTLECLARGVEDPRGKIRSLLRLLRRDGVEGAIRSDLLVIGRSLDELGRTLSWLDFDAWLSNLPGRSAYRRLVDPMGVFTDVEADIQLNLTDEIRKLRVQLAGGNPDELTPTVERLRQVFAQREAAKQEPAQNVTDIRTRKPPAPQQKAERQPSNARDRIAQAQARARAANQ